MDRRQPQQPAYTTSRALRVLGVATGAKRRAGSGDENEASSRGKRQRTKSPSLPPSTSLPFAGETSTSTRSPLQERQFCVYPPSPPFAFRPIADPIFDAAQSAIKGTDGAARRSADRLNPFSTADPSRPSFSKTL